MAEAWQIRGGELSLDRPLVMGILNVTPDSFSDGGEHCGVDAALAHAGRMLRDGADIIDVGGESTRPGASPVDEAEERRRVVPAIAAIRAAHPGAAISVDTRRASVAVAAIEAGANIVNDITALGDEGMAGAVAAAGAGIVLMHGGRAPAVSGATHAFAIDEREYSLRGADGVAQFLRESAKIAQERGIARAAICLDPGFGFGKDADANWSLLEGLGGIAALGYPLLVGASRKRFIRGSHDPKSAEAAARLDEFHRGAYLAGARIFRVHDCAAARVALDGCANPR